MLIHEDYHRLTVLLVQILYKENMAQRRISQKEHSSGRASLEESFSTVMASMKDEMFPQNILPEQESDTGRTPEENIILINLLKTCTQHVLIIEEVIKKALHRPFARLDVTLQSILQLGVGDILLRRKYFGKCPLPERSFGKIIANYLHVSHVFFDEGTGKLVHGVLSRILKEDLPSKKDYSKEIKN